MKLIDNRIEKEMKSYFSVLHFFSSLNVNTAAFGLASY